MILGDLIPLAFHYFGTCLSYHGLKQIAHEKSNSYQQNMNQIFATEWIVRLSEAASASAHTVVVYRTEYALDADGDSGIKRLWVAARGYEGGGIFGAFSAVASYADTFLETIVACQEAFPEGVDFESSENYEVLTDSDLQVLGELWTKIDELTAFDLDADDPFVAKVSVPEDEDFIVSDGWDPDDLLEPISEEWQLFLKF